MSKISAPSKRNYVNAIDTETQNIITAGSWQGIPVNYNNVIDGWTHEVYSAGTISFTAPSTISDSASGLGNFLVGDTIKVSGSVGNDGLYTVATVAAGTVTVNEVTIVNGVAGPTVTIAADSFVCYESGNYLFSGFAHTNKTGGANSLFEFGLSINGTPAGTVFCEYLASNGVPSPISGSGILPLSAGMIVRMIWTAGASSQIIAPATVLGSTKSCSITISKIT